MNRDFKTYAKQHNLNQHNFPWSWLTDFSRGARTFTLVLLLISFIFQFLLKANFIIEPLIQKNQIEIAKSLLKAHNFIKRFNVLLIFLVIIFSLLKILSYILRSRAFERDAKANDKEAGKLKNKIINIAKVRAKLNSIHKKVSKSKESTSYEDKAKIEAYDAIINMKVNIHTRESLEDGTIKKLYKIAVKLPDNALAEKNVLDELKNYNIIATKACEGLIQFGQYTVAADRSVVEFMEEIIVPDKYAVVETVKEEKPKEYESAFSKTLFIDRSAEKAAKIDAAERYGNNVAKSVDTLLATKGIQAIRKKVTAGSANALIVYQLSLNLSGDGVNSLSEALDKALRVTGTDVSIDAGDLKIAIPVPKSLSLPIDLPSMYTEIFG